MDLKRGCYLYNYEVFVNNDFAFERNLSMPRLDPIRCCTKAWRTNLFPIKVRKHPYK